MARARRITQKRHQCQFHGKNGFQTTSTSIETQKTPRPSMRRAPSLIGAATVKVERCLQDPQASPHTTGLVDSSRP